MSSTKTNVAVKEEVTELIRKENRSSRLSSQEENVLRMLYGIKVDDKAPLGTKEVRGEEEQLKLVLMEAEALKHIRKEAAEELDRREGLIKKLNESY